MKKLIFIGIWLWFGFTPLTETAYYSGQQAYVRCTKCHLRFLRCLDTCEKIHPAASDEMVEAFKPNPEPKVVSCPIDGSPLNYEWSEK